MSHGAAYSTAYELGDIKHAARTADHNGWYRLNGRAVATLPAAAQDAAIALGFTANLPNFSDRSIQERGAMGAIRSPTAMVRAHLPQVTLAGNTPSGGAHSHNFTPAPPYASTLRPTFEVNQQNQANINVIDWTLSQAQINNRHSHTFTLDLGGTDTPVVAVQRYRSFAAFVYLGS